jgi:hypothetical protein
MRYLSQVLFGVIGLLLLIWLPAIELIRRTITPWRERRKREMETGTDREFIVQVGPFKIVDRPISTTEKGPQAR